MKVDDTFLYSSVQVLSNAGLLLLILWVVEAVSCRSSFHPFTTLASPLGFRFLTFGCLCRPLLQPSQKPNH